MNKELTLFYTGWTTSCKKVLDYIDELNGDGYTVTKVNIDDNPALVDQLDVKAIPTVILFDNGNELDRVVGDVDKEVLIEKLNI